MRTHSLALRVLAFGAVLATAAALDATGRPLLAQQDLRPGVQPPPALPSPLTPVAVQDTAARSRSGWTSLRVAKWTTAVAATGLVVYGVVNNRNADNRYDELEQVCVEEPARCDQRAPDGSYADTELESRYQDIRRLDSRARSALLAGQVGMAASVLLFVLDLRNDDGPENIPYEPRTFDAGRSRDGGLSLQINLRVPGGR